MLLSVDVRSSLLPEDLRRQVEERFPSFDVRAGSSGVQGGRYVSASFGGSGRRMLMKAWFYDDEPGRFSVQISGDESLSEQDKAPVASIRAFLDELGAVSDR